MDIKYTITVENVPTKTDAVTLAAVEAVDITAVESERQNDFTVCSDTSSITSPGVIKRVIIAELSAQFETRFPTFNDRYHALEKAFVHVFRKQLPGSSAEVNEGIELGAFCP